MLGLYGLIVALIMNTKAQSMKVSFKRSPSSECMLNNLLRSVEQLMGHVQVIYSVSCREGLAYEYDAARKQGTWRVVSTSSWYILDQHIWTFCGNCSLRYSNHNTYILDSSAQLHSVHLFWLNIPRQLYIR